MFLQENRQLRVEYEMIVKRDVGRSHNEKRDLAPHPGCGRLNACYRGYHFADAPFNPRLRIFEPLRVQEMHGRSPTENSEEALRVEEMHGRSPTENSEERLLPARISLKAGWDF
jgi:hypothetical protein